MKMISWLIILSLVCGMAYLQYRYNFYWNWVGKRKWRALQPRIKEIRDIHEWTVAAEKETNWLKKQTNKLEKNCIRSKKSALDKCKEKYVQYIYFCNEKRVNLPENKAELDELIDVTENALLKNGELLDKDLQKTGEQYDTTYKLVSEAGENLLSQRQESVQLIDQVEELVNTISRYPKTFETEIQEMIVQKQHFKRKIEYGREQTKAIKESIKCAGVGVTTGAIIASAAPKAAIWVATTFGTASSGTAIAALNGSVATNAALAWLGGGAMVAGGGGMAAGQALLALAGPIGWGIAGTTGILSLWFFKKKKNKLQKSKKNEIARMKKCIEALKELKGKMDQISIETSGIFERIQKALEICNTMRGQDYTSFSDEQKEALGALVNNTKSLSALLNRTVGA